MKQKFKEIVQQVAPDAVATVGDVLYEMNYKIGVSFQFRYVKAPGEWIIRITVYDVDGKRITLTEVDLRVETCAELVAYIVKAQYLYFFELGRRI